MIELTGITLYLTVFFLRVLGSTFAHCRILLIADQKIIATIMVNMLSSFLWLVTAAFVVDNIASDPLLVLAYVFGVVVGSYTGSYLNNKLSKANSFVTVITEKNHISLVNDLEKQGFIVSMVNGEGKNENKKIIMVASPKIEQKKMLDIIFHNSKNNFVVGEKVDELIV